ncbi:MAG TPA: hypothetical protein VNI36_12500 [Candidatus Dormibacteraeota bacterium]|nr:hypothetical protein [Candidatus Dormibacteraeota bacterium]
MRCRSAGRLFHRSSIRPGKLADAGVRRMHDLAEVMLDYSRKRLAGLPAQ